MAAKTMAEKITALLSKTVERGASEAEALAAAQMAQRLMAKYNIELIDLSTDAEPENVDMTTTGATRRWEQLLISVVAQNMRCQVLVRTVDRKALVKIFGFDTDRRVALETCKMLLTVCRAGIKREKASARKRTGSTAGVEDAYAFSFIQAVQDEMGKSSRALMLVVPKEVDEFVRERCPRIRQQTVGARSSGNADSIRSAETAGYSDGRSAMGRRQLTACKA